MKKFRVLLTRDVTESGTVEVYADDREGAGDKALELVADEVVWSRNDSVGDEMYLGGGWPPEDGGDVTEIDENGNDVPTEGAGNGI